MLVKSINGSWFFVKSDSLISKESDASGLNYHIDEIRDDGKIVLVKGWVVELEYLLPPKEILVSNRSLEIVASTSDFTSRADVAKLYKAQIENFGFRIQVKKNFFQSGGGVSLVALLHSNEYAKFFVKEA